MRKGLGRIAAGILLVAAMAATAKDGDKNGAVNADSREKLQTVEAGVKAQMEKGGRYEHLTDSERATVEKKFSEMDALFTEHATVAEMSQDNKLKLFNDQEEINGILTKRDNERMICKKEAPIGSHIPVTTCHTYAQEQEMHKASSKQMDDWSRSQSGAPGH